MRSRAAVLFAPVREWSLLEEAESTARRYTSPPEPLVAGHVRAAENHLRASCRLGDALPASVLLRLDIVHLLGPRAATADARFDGDALASLALSTALRDAPLHEDSAQTPEGTGWARAALVSRDSLFLDRLSPDALEATRAVVERTSSSQRRRVEPRSAAKVRGTRWRRWSAIVVVFAYVLVRLVVRAFFPTNVALNNAGYPSSSEQNPPHAVGRAR